MTCPNSSEVSVGYALKKCVDHSLVLPYTIWSIKQRRKLIRIFLAENGTTFISSLLLQSIQRDLPSSATPATTV